VSEADSAHLHAGIFAGEPRWLPKRRLLTLRIPLGVQSWLFDRDSLTRRVRDLCPGCFRVQVLDEGLARPMFNERRLLSMADHQLAVVRQVQLLCDDQPWVFARTVIPLPTLRGPGGRLALLGDKPLGEMLFANSTMRRFEVQVARILPVHRLFHAATFNLHSKPVEIWGRRSVFQLHGKPLLVSEVFLPRLLARGALPAGLHIC
jgi:chorismate--pyruvate lyase